MLGLKINLKQHGPTTLTNSIFVLGKGYYLLEVVIEKSNLIYQVQENKFFELSSAFGKVIVAFVFTSPVFPLHSDGLTTGILQKFGKNCF